MPNKRTYIIVALLLIFAASICVLSIRNDSLTMDEQAHLPAGYSYLTQQDMRINPEHPPLVKDLSAVPLLFIKDINFPYKAQSWEEDINGQWDFGNRFLFKSQNPAEKMIFWGRIPMIFLLLILGFYVFLWTREIFGNKAGLIALFLYSFSPTFLAHGRLVTTDLAAALGAFIATYYFVKFLKKPVKKYIIYAGIAFGIAQLLKFSLILLFPLFIFLFIVWAIVKASNKKDFVENLGRYFVLTVLVGLIALALIWAVYVFHTWNYPPEKQVSDTENILASFGSRPLANAVVWMADKPILKGLGQYILGIFMVLQRASGGNTGYFLGEVSFVGWKTYFPAVYFLKETLVFHLLTVISLFYAVCRIKRPWQNNIPARVSEWIKYHLPEFAMLGFIAIYWASSLSSNLNIGVRHLLPTLPFVMVLVGGVTSMWLKEPRKKLKTAFIIWLVLWQAYSVVSVYPHFLAYFNETIGGPSEGHKYVVDSNLDWGQDLKRLKQWTEKENIDKIYVDYFGGSDLEYHLGDKYKPWNGTSDPEEFPKGNYLAVSATFLQSGRGKPAPTFKSDTDFYRWLDNETLAKRIGYSIFVYYID